MIRQLRGQIVGQQITSDTLASIVIDVMGVGYYVLTTPQTALTLEEALNKGTAETVLHTSLIVREDAMQLVGFLNVAERELFDLLQSASGVGLKMAVAILAQLGWREVVTAIVAGNTAQLTQVKGVGPKVAGKITLELKDKLKAWQAESASRLALTALSQTDGTGTPGDSGLITSTPAIEEAQAVLLSLGYSGQETAQALGWFARESTTPLDTVAVEDVLQQTLQYLAVQV
ncbi:MAG: Holliday junction branch migration protein RuvA [Cyanobacteria bacterium HKST-UBA06]|nr:Holliday junction branch migration protein RuvA [Cyanobacteria bacterium HKST-UBA06]